MKYFTELVRLTSKSKDLGYKLKTAERQKLNSSKSYSTFSGININHLNANLISFIFYIASLFILIALFRNIDNIQTVYEVKEGGKAIAEESLVALASITTLFSWGSAIVLMLDFFVLRKMEIIKNKIKDLKEIDDTSSQSVLVGFFIIIGFSSFFPISVMFFVTVALIYIVLGLIIFLPVKIYHFCYSKYLQNRKNNDEVSSISRKIKSVKSEIIDITSYITEDPQEIEELIHAKKEYKINTKEELEVYNNLIDIYYKNNINVQNKEDLILSVNNENKESLVNL